MTPDIAICLAILGGAVLLFAWDRIAGRRRRARRHARRHRHRTAARRQGLRRLRQRHRDHDPGPADHVGRPDPDRRGRDRRPLRVRSGGAQPGDLPARDHGLGGRRLRLHEQHGGDRVLRAAGDRLCQQDRRKPVAVPAAARLRVDPDKLGHADQHLDQPGRQRSPDPLPAAAHGHVRAGAGRHSHRHRRHPLRLADRRAPAAAARGPEAGGEDRRAQLPGRCRGRRGGAAGRQVARRRQDRGRRRTVGGQADARRRNDARRERALRDRAAGRRRAADRGTCAPISQDQGHRGPRLQGRCAPRGRGRGRERTRRSRPSSKACCCRARR